MLDKLKQTLKFETYTEFCDRCDEIVEAYKNATLYKEFSTHEYKNYIYYQHTFSKNKNRDLAAKDKIFEYIMGYKFEKLPKQELFVIKTKLRKGK